MTAICENHPNLWDLGFKHLTRPLWQIGNCRELIGQAPVSTFRLHGVLAITPHVLLGVTHAPLSRFGFPDSYVHSSRSSHARCGANTACSCPFEFVGRADTCSLLSH